MLSSHRFGPINRVLLLIRISLVWGVVVGIGNNLLIITELLAIEFKADIYSETGLQKLNSFSSINGNEKNSLNLNQEEFYTRAALEAKGGYKKVRGLIKLENIYAPVDFTRSAPAVDSAKDRAYLKAAYLNMEQEDWSVGIGKQFISWGSGVFFSPLDIINYNRNPLRPLDEAEGNSFIRFSFLDENITTEVYFVAIPERAPYQVMGYRNLQAVPRIAGSFGNFSFFAFSRIRGMSKPVWGLNLNYVLSSGENSDLSIFGEALLKNDREKLSLEDQQQKQYPALLAGLQAKFAITRSKRLDGVILNFEYYYDRANWSHREFERYLQNSQLLYPYYSLFSNSRQYLFTSVFLQSFLAQDFRPGISVVYNIEDKSALYYPEMVYALDNQNANIGARFFLFNGGKNSELGTYPVSKQVIIYGELTF